MSRQESVTIAVVLLSLGAGAFLGPSRLSLWCECGARLMKALLPRAVQYLARRMSPEDGTLLEADRQGQGTSGDEV